MSFVLLGIDQDRGRLLAVPSGQRSNRRAGVSHPFTLKKAREYTDTFADPPRAGQRQSYIESRDLILSKLSEAFSQKETLPFIRRGSAVLDAVATLLDGEKNYHKLSTEVGGGQASR